MTYRQCSIFLSHTRLDKEFCDKLDNAAASEGVRRFRSEFETLQAPAWRTIKREIDQSSALFLLVGNELVRAQESSLSDWKYTQNWIAYEVGLACNRGIDVWVWCEAEKINFPVPYLNNYVLQGFGAYREKDYGDIGMVRYVLRQYKRGRNFPLGWHKREISCPHETCGAQFNLHSVLFKDSTFLCPTCLKEIVIDVGWLTD